MKIVYVFLGLSIAMLPALAHASATTAAPSENEANAHPVSVTGESSSGIQKKFEENRQITDAELKSRAGSLSRISLKATLNYSGPTLDDLSATNQPNPDNTVSATAVGPSGSIGARLRLDSSTSISVNAGVTGQYLFTRKPSTLDFKNPFITYDKSFKIGGVQVVASPGLTWVTSNVYRQVGQLAGIDSKIYAAYDLGDSPFSVGTSVSASYYFFDRDYAPDQVTKSGRVIKRDGRVGRISATLAPNIKYKLSSKFSINTSWGFQFLNPRYYDSALKFNSRLVNQWLGVGYAITRDIYINPYIQFYPTDFSWRTTTMNLNTVFSVL